MFCAISIRSSTGPSRRESHIGYFAALYRRVTLGIREAIIKGEFDDGRRIEQLDVAFARRYFNALNAYFDPAVYHGLTLPWEVSFAGDQTAKRSSCST